MMISKNNIENNLIKNSDQNINILSNNIEKTEIKNINNEKYNNLINYSKSE